MCVCDVSVYVCVWGGVLGEGVVGIGRCVRVQLCVYYDQINVFGCRLL